MQVILIGIFPYRSAGGAASGRLRNLALGLKHAGALPTLWYVGNEGIESECQGVRIEQFSRHARPRRKSFDTRINAWAVEAISKRLEMLAGQGEVDAVIFYNQDALYALKLVRICSRLSVPFFQQYAEIHLPADFQQGWRSTYFLMEWLHLRLLPRFGSGSVVISRELARQVDRRSLRSSLILPTVAPVAPAKRRVLGAPVKLLCVSGGARRDELPLLLRALAKARNAGADVLLMIVGLADVARENLATLVTELALSKAAELRGYVSDEEYAAALAAADAFVLLRSDDLSSRACYPSRLQEYFGTGAPVVLTSVGDLCQHFQDDRDCLMVPPGDVTALSEALRWLDAQRDRASQIGLRGNARARELFDVAAAGRKLLGYLQACRPATK